MRRFTIPVITAVAAVSLGLVLAELTTSIKAQQVPTTTKRKQEDARLKGGLRAAAAITGTYTGEEPANEGSPLTLAQLAGFSQLIVMGRVQSNSSILVGNGRTVSTVYTVLVESALKANPQAGGVIQIVVPGGRFGFEDGSWAQINPAGFLGRPINAKQYVWFLRRARPGQIEGNEAVLADSWSLAFGPLGVYPTEDVTSIRPMGLLTTRFAREISQKKYSTEAFLADLNVAMGR